MDIEKIPADAVVKFLLGLLEPLNIRVQAGQDRRNQRADVEAYRQIVAANPGVERFEGLATVIESRFQGAGAEQSRQANNVIHAALKALMAVEQERPDLDALSPEFRYRWVHEASNVSDETLADLWARLLAGELDSPGNISNDTMSVARDMTKEIAEEFQKLCSMALCYVNSQNPVLVVSLGDLESSDLYRKHGMHHGIFSDLAYYRLIESAASMYSVPKELALKGFLVTWAGIPWHMKWIGDDNGWPDQGSPIRSIPGIRFTPAGRQLCRVVTRTHLTYEVRMDMWEFIKKLGWEMDSPLWAPSWTPPDKQKDGQNGPPAQSPDRVGSSSSSLES